MKTKFILLVSATALSCLPILADNLSDNSNNNANQNPSQRNDSPQGTVNQNQTVQSQYNTQSDRDRDEYHHGKMDRLGDLRKANKIIGAEITDDQGQKLGKVKDLALDLQNGRIVEVIVATGGVLGMDQKLIAVPPSSFTCDKTMDALHLNLDKDQLKSSPEFMNSDWTSATANMQVKEVYQRYGVRPYFERPGMDVNNTNVNYSNDTRSQGLSPQDKLAQDQRGVVPNNDNAVNGPTTLATGTNYYNETGLDHHRAWRNVSLGYVASANHLMGTTAMNDQNEKLGKIDNFIVDLPAGRVVEVILASGGFLGMDAQMSAVPPQSFRWNADNTEVTLDTTAENLKTAPHFKSSEWGYATQPATVTQVYSTYRVPAYWTTGEDNTAQNVRDRDGQNLTPMDQGNSQPDINTTAQIRKAVMADSSLSSNAKNVKIITANGRVTLRGVVNSQQEKDTIASDASNVVSKDQVDNQLRVRGDSNNNSESPGTSPTSTDSTGATK